MKPSIILALLLLLATLSCKKDSDVGISDMPELEFISATPAVVKEFKDSVTFTIAYKDGNGDLGENNANAKNLYLTDKRNNVVYAYRIKELVPQGSTIAIQGKLNIVLKNTAITNGSGSQTTTFGIYVTDRAGNKSNEVNSGVINVVK